MLTRSVALVSFTLLGVLGCAHRQGVAPKGSRAASTSTPPTSASATSRSGGAAEARRTAPIAIPAGRTLTVRLEDPIGTTTRAGKSFQAEVLTPLEDAAGDVLVPPGARIVGRVVEVEATPEPSMKLAFQTVATPAGPVPISATVVSAADNPCYQAEEVRQTALAYDAILRPRAPGRAPIGGGPGGRPTCTSSAHSLELSRGATLRLVLTAPLTFGMAAPPGAPHLPR